MKELWNTLISKIPKKKKRKKTHIPKVYLHKDERVHYKGKRNQLKISFGSYKNLDFIKTNKKNILIGLFPVGILVFLFILFGPFFTIQTVNIIRNDSITDLSLAYSAIENIRGEKMIQVNEQDIKSKLIEYQNNIKDIAIDLKLPDSLDIHISSYPVYFNALMNEKQYFITQNGVLVPGKNRDDLKNIEIKAELNKNILPDYNQIYKQDHIEAIYDGYLFLQENIIDINIQNIFYYPLEREVHFGLENSTLLIYTLSKNLKNQIEKTVIYNTEHNKLSNNNMVYIDFRATQKTGQNEKDKIFSCPLTEETQCLQNLKKIY